MKLLTKEEEDAHYRYVIHSSIYSFILFYFILGKY